jgi:hypothetical protein
MAFSIRRMLGLGKLKAKGKTRHKANSWIRQNSRYPGPDLREYLRTFANHDIELAYGRKPRWRRHTGDLMDPASVKRIPNPRARRTRRGSQRGPIWQSSRGIAQLDTYRKRKRG